MHTNLKEGDHREYLGINGRIILNQEERSGMGLDCFLLDKNGDQRRPLENNKINLRVP
jgi:hypothetical protein